MDMITDELAATLLNSSPDGLMLVSGDGVIGVANRSASTLFGYSVDEMSGMNVDQLVPREQRSTHHLRRRSYLAEPAQRPMGTGLQLFGEHADGSMFPIEISLSPVLLDGDMHTIATVRDVSDRQESLAHVALLKERERIARDLHDMVIQRLFAAGMSLQAIAGSVAPEAAAKRILEVTEELDETIHELRSAIFNLGQPDQSRTLSAHIAEVVQERARQLGFRPTLTLVGDLEAIDDLVGEQLAATIAEALSNVARHAGATAAEVLVTSARDSVQLRVTDNGVGIAPVKKSRGGISNMMWRAAELGGVCSVAPAAPSGTQLDWHVPVVTSNGH